MEDIIKKILQNKKDVKINEEKVKNQSQIAEQIWKEIEKNDGGKLFVFRAPPGYGKTEVFSSLIIKNFLQDEWYFPKAYIVEPTHALLSQMKDRLEESISTFQLNDIFVSEDHGELVYPSYLYSGTVMVTTIDAYVYGYLAKRVKNGSGESGRFSMPVGLETNSLTVFDEIHLIQDEAYLGPNVISKIICPIVKAGGYVLLNSATMPDEFINKIAGGCEDHKVDIQNVNNYGSDVSISVKDISETDEIIKEIIDKIKSESDKKYLVIVNTIKRAIEYYNRIRSEVQDAILLHSLFTHKDKENIINKIKEGSFKVVVGTQVFETGIDYDFDVVFTESSPIDSIIQRVSRAGRRDRKGEAFVYNVNSNLPYYKELFDQSWNIIKDHLSSLNLKDINQITNVVNQIYTQDLISKLEENGSWLYASSLAYMYSLHLLSFPPERDEFYLRPSYYVEIVLQGQDVNDLLQQSCDRNIIKDNSIRVSLSLLRRSTISNALFKKSNKVYELVYKQEDNLPCELRKFDVNKYDIKPGHIYVLDLGELYDQQIGLDVTKLNVEETSEETTRKRKGGKRKEGGQ